MKLQEEILSISNKFQFDILYGVITKWGLSFLLLYLFKNEPSLLMLNLEPLSTVCDLV